MRVEQETRAQLYFDRGDGLRETDSSVRTVKPDRDLADVDFPIPAGRLRELRFDPMTTSGVFMIGRPRLVDTHGKAIATFSLEDISPSNEIAHLKVENQKLIGATTASATDPQLTIHFKGPLQVKAARLPWPEAAMVFLLVLLTRRYIA